jgi:hypothetical protein
LGRLREQERVHAEIVKVPVGRAFRGVLARNLLHHSLNLGEDPRRSSVAHDDLVVARFTGNLFKTFMRLG